jgi:hypothetical protein
MRLRNWRVKTLLSNWLRLELLVKLASRYSKAIVIILYLARILEISFMECLTKWEEINHWLIDI